MARDKASKIVWAITVVLALLMVGAAVYISVNNKRAQTAQSASIAPEKAPQAVVADRPVVPFRTKEPEIKQPERQAPIKSEPVKRPIGRTESSERTAPSPPVAMPSITDDARLNEIQQQQQQNTAEANALDFDLSNIAGRMNAQMKLVGADKNKMPLRHTCYRNNVSPPLSWSGAPSRTQSFAVLLEKNNVGEDVVTSWILFNVPASKTSLPENVPPPEHEGMRFGVSNYGNPEYVGPCDPKGKQKYRIRIFALDTVLDNEVGVSKNDLIRSMNGHIIDMAEINFIHYFKL